jgi:CBS domain-containing protein
MNVNEIITRDAEVIRPDTVLIEAAQKMNALDIGMLPVCDGDRLVGMVTDRDITVRGVAQGCDPRTARVREVMTPEVIYCFDDEDVNDVPKRWKRGKCGACQCSTETNDWSASSRWVIWQSDWQRKISR